MGELCWNHDSTWMCPLKLMILTISMSSFNYSAYDKMMVETFQGKLYDQDLNSLLYAGALVFSGVHWHSFSFLVLLIFHVFLAAFKYCDSLS